MIVIHLQYLRRINRAGKIVGKLRFGNKLGKLSSFGVLEGEQSCQVLIQHLQDTIIHRRAAFSQDLRHARLWGSCKHGLTYSCLREDTCCLQHSDIVRHSCRSIYIVAIRSVVQLTGFPCTIAIQSRLDACCSLQYRSHRTELSLKPDSGAFVSVLYQFTVHKRTFSLGRHRGFKELPYTAQLGESCFWPLNDIRLIRYDQLTISISAYSLVELEIGHVVIGVDSSLYLQYKSANIIGVYFTHTRTPKIVRL